MSNERYFTVYFTGTDGQYLQRGKMHVTIGGGGYVNEQTIHEAIENEFGYKDPYVSGITELSEEDFYDYLATFEDKDSNDHSIEFL